MNLLLVVGDASELKAEWLLMDSGLVHFQGYRAS
jgi:hypothetical protein